MTQEKKVQTAAVMDVTGVERSAQDAVRAAKAMAEGITREGEKAGKGIEAMGAGAEKAERSVDAATKSISDRLRRLTRDAQRDLASLAASSTGGAGSASALEYESVLKGANSAKLQPQIDAFRELKAQVDSLNASMRQASENEAFLAGINSRTTALQRQAAAASLSEADLLALKAAEMGVAQQADPLIAKLRAAAAAADEVAAASKRAASGDKFLSGLNNQAGAIGKTRADLLELQAAELGVTEKARPMIQAIRDADNKLYGIGATSKATAAAMRGVPAQMTDIFVSLQGGQNPLQVFLQQGGQLKDMFGGIGPAARALGGYLVGLLSPMNLAIAAAVGLAVAYELGANEILALQKTIVLSGNAIGVTAGQLQLAAAAVRDIGASTQGAASELINKFAANAAIASDNIERFAAAALRMQKVGGPAAEETAKAFESLAKNPLQAANKLNEGTNFLTKSLQDQIKALQDQGKTTDAARVAQEAYASAIEQRIPQVAATLGTVEKVWINIKSAILGALDAGKGIGRDLGVEQQMDALRKGMADIEAGKLGEGARKDLPALQQQLMLLEKGAGYQALDAAYARERALSTEANTRQQERLAAALGQQAQLGLAIKKIQEDGKIAGTDPDEIARLVQFERQRYDTGVNLVQIRTAESEKLELIKRGEMALEALRVTGGLNQINFIEERGRSEIAALNIKRDAVQQELALAKVRINNEREVAALEAQAAGADQQITTQRIKNRQALGIAIYQQRQAIYAVLNAQREEGQQQAADTFVQQYKQREQVSIAISAQSAELADELELLRLEASLLGASDQQRQITIDRLRIEQRLRKQINEVDKTPYEGGEADRELDRARVRRNAEMEAINASNRVIQDSFKQTAESITDSLSNAIIEGLSRGASFADEIRKSLTNMFKDMVLRPTIKAIISPVGNALASVFGSLTGSLGLSGAAQAGQAVGGGASSGLLGALGLGGIGAGLGALGSFGATGLMSTLTGTGLGTTLGAAGSLVGSGSVAGGIGLGLGAIAPYALAAVVIANLLKSKDAKLGFGASQIAANGDSTSAIGRQFAFGNGKDIGQQSELFLVADTLAKSIADQAKALGGNANGLQVQAASDIDRTGKGSGIIAILRDGKIAGSGIQTGGTNSTTTAATKLENAADLSKFFAESSSAAIIAGLKASSLPKRMADYFGTIDAFSLDQTKANEILAVAAGVNSLTTALNPLGGVFSRLGDLGISATNELAALTGGLDAFSAKAQSYVQAFYSRDEIAGIKATEVQNALAAAGITQPVDTKEQFRALVDATDLSTQTGREQLATLLNVSSTFAEVADYLAETNSTLAQAALQAPAAGALLGLQGPSEADANAPQITAIGAVETAVISVGDTIRELIDVIKDQGRWEQVEVGGP